MKILGKIKKEIEKIYSKMDCHNLEHIERVYKISLEIGKKEKADLEVLGIACLLHDIARSKEDLLNGKIDHAKEGALMAKKILQKYQLPKEKLENILHCIETHRYKNKKVPFTKEAKILYDADKLDALGAIGIGRAFSFAGKIGAKIHNKEVDISKTKAYSIEDTAWREYQVKLKYLKNNMLTKEGRRLARERDKFMREFFKRLNKEVEGKI